MTYNNWRKSLNTSKTSIKTLNQLKSLAATASISVSVTLCLIKAVAAVTTGSLSILSSMIDSLTDILSSSISFIAVKFSNKPLTENHRYGYGKAESVSALMQAAFIAGSGGFILYDGIGRFIKPMPITQTAIGLWVMGISTLLTLFLITFQAWVVKKTKSTAIQADSAHYTVDLLTNGAIVLSLIIVHYLDWQWFDSFTAIVISLYLLWNAAHIALSALEEITDHEVDNDIKKTIIQIVQEEKDVKGYHDFRTRVSGLIMFIEIHLEMDGNLSLAQAHDISDNVEAKIIKVFPLAQIIIHQDPYGLHEKRLDHEIQGLCDL